MPFSPAIASRNQAVMVCCHSEEELFLSRLRRLIVQRRDRHDTHHLGFRRDEEGVLAEEKRLHSLGRGGRLPSLEVQQKLFHWHG